MKKSRVFGNHPTSRRRDLRRYEGVVVHKNVARGHEMYGFRVADRARDGLDFESICELRDLGHADVRCAQSCGCSDERDAAHDRGRLLQSIRFVDGVLAGAEGSTGCRVAASGVSQCSVLLVRAGQWSETEPQPLSAAQPALLRRGTACGSTD